MAIEWGAVGVEALYRPDRPDNDYDRYKERTRLLSRRMTTMRRVLLPALAATVLVLVPGCSRNTTEPQPSTPTAAPTTAVPGSTTSVNPNALDDKIELCEAISTRVTELSRASNAFVDATNAVPTWDYSGEILDKADKLVQTTRRVVPIVQSLIGPRVSSAVAQPLREYLETNSKYATAVEQRRYGDELNQTLDAARSSGKALSAACRWSN